MRRSTIYSAIAVAIYLATVCLAVFVVAPVSVTVADFVASCGIAIPRPSGWNRAIFANTGTPALHVTFTGLVALIGYGSIIAGGAFYLGDHEDVRAQLNNAAETPAGRRRSDGAGSNTGAAQRPTNIQVIEGDG